MNKNIDLTKILKNCPKGTKLYSTVHGEVTFEELIEDDVFPINVMYKGGGIEGFTAEGKLEIYYDGECTLFPSKEQRDWSKFAASWYKKEKFDPKTLKPLDTVIVRSDDKCRWFLDSFSYIYPDSICVCTGGCDYKQCIPYNEDTKHLVGSTEEAPEFYKYWEN